MEKTFRLTKKIPNTRHKDLVLPSHTSNASVEVLGDSGQILGFANVFSDEKDLVADCYLQYVSPERLNLQIDNRMYLSAYGYKIGESGFFLHHLEVSGHQSGDYSTPLTHLDLE